MALWESTLVGWLVCCDPAEGVAEQQQQHKSTHKLCSCLPFMIVSCECMSIFHKFSLSLSFLTLTRTVVYGGSFCLLLLMMAWNYLCLSAVAFRQSKAEQSTEQKKEAKGSEKN